MNISDDKIKYLCGLAMLDMGPDEKEAQRQDLERIATYTEKLRELDTTGMQELPRPFGNAGPTAGAGSGKDGTHGENRFRPDEVTSPDRAEEWVKAAPDSKGLYIRVPRTVEE